MGIHDTTEDVLAFLRNNATSSIYDYFESSTTKIETDADAKLSLLKNEITVKKNVKCLREVGITELKLMSQFSSYTDSLNPCLKQACIDMNIDIIEKFNPAHFPTLLMLTKIGKLLDSCITRSCLENFVSAKTCFN